VSGNSIQIARLRIGDAASWRATNDGGVDLLEIHQHVDKPPKICRHADQQTPAAPIHFLERADNLAAGLLYLRRLPQMTSRDLVPMAGITAVHASAGKFAGD
jgi:hypothetical protein